jgi:signal transduction histidine kinase
MPTGDQPEGRPDAETTLALAHALRTPLTSLALGLGLLDEGALGALNEAQREVVRALVADVGRLTLLVDRGLETDRLGAHAGPVERVAVDLGALVHRAAAPIVRQAEDRGVRVSLALPGGVQVVADPVKLAWVAASLMGNALRYSPRGATIDVTLARAARTRDAAELRIRDRGPGVAPETRARLFARDGGPGLFLAREIVEAHGGRIRVGSKPGRGSIFTVTLPAAPR